ncbi:ABC transporter ATP-binding protein [Hyphobacterium sp. CCMP332]|nr:ABC transporter ATP-binding protein [Hyphobacterium sp. CCMP332]
MKALQYLNKYLYKYRLRLILGVIFVIISNILQIIPASLVRHALDLMSESYDLLQYYKDTDVRDIIEDSFISSALLYGLIILLMVVLRGIFLFFTRQTIIVVSRLIEFDLKNEIYWHYQTLPLAFYRRNNTGDLMSRISEDVSKVRMYLGPAIMYGLNLIVLFMICIPVMFSINSRLSLYVLAPLPVLSISIYFVNNLINKKSEMIQQKLSDLSTYVQEAFSGIRVLKSFVREKDSVNNFTRESNDYKTRSLDLAFVNALFFPLIMALIGLSTIFTIYIGGLEVARGSITVGNIGEFVMYVNYLVWPVTSLGWISSIIQRADASQRRINQFLETKTDIISGDDDSKKIEGEIEFNNVSFTYPDSGIRALKNISFKAKSGETIAIVGHTGSGKSTIANLLTRMYDPIDGEVKIDDTDIKKLDLTHLRNQMGYVPQDVFLFSDSISKNIAFGSVNEKPELIEEAARDADLFDNIKDFPQGFDTRLGERGITLSGGQKQRTSIARALIRKPKILILDDCLSAVDTKTENAILESLSKVSHNITTLIISHRVSSVKLADKILVLDDGQIIEEGSHEELMQNDGPYKDLYNKQLEGEEVE